MSDWSLGTYELTAERLQPAADVAVAALAPQPGERVVDVACGTGNAALVAAKAGATVIGVDLSPRLLEVARRRAGDHGLTAEFAAGDAVDLPFEDDTFDAAVSVFGVIFADTEAATRELLRVVRPGGRIVITTWTVGGPTPQVLDAVREALGAPPAPPRWSDPEIVRSLFAPHEIRMEEAGLAFTAPSAAAYVAEQEEHHPLWIASAPALDQRGARAAVTARATEIYMRANEDPAAFRTTSRYVVTTVSVEWSVS